MTQTRSRRATTMICTPKNSGKIVEAVVLYRELPSAMLNELWERTTSFLAWRGPALKRVGYNAAGGCGFRPGVEDALAPSTPPPATQTPSKAPWRRPALSSKCAGMTVSLSSPSCQPMINSRVWRAAEDRERTSRTGTSSRRLGPDRSLEDNAVPAGKYVPRRRGRREAPVRTPAV